MVDVSKQTEDNILDSRCTFRWKKKDFREANFYDYSNNRIKEGILWRKILVVMSFMVGDHTSQFLSQAGHTLYHHQLLANFEIHRRKDNF